MDDNKIKAPIDVDKEVAKAAPFKPKEYGYMHNTTSPMMFITVVVITANIVVLMSRYTKAMDWAILPMTERGAANARILQYDVA